MNDLFSVSVDFRREPVISPILPLCPYLSYKENGLCWQGTLPKVSGSLPYVIILR